MWIKYAIEILIKIESNRMRADSRVAVSAMKYLLARKTVSNEIKERAKKILLEQKKT